MSAVICTFDRIGRNHYVPPLRVESNDPYDVAQAVYRLARKHCVSRDINVECDDGKGIIFAGFHLAGSFTIEPAA